MKRAYEEAVTPSPEVWKQSKRSKESSSLNQTTPYEERIIFKPTRIPETEDYQIKRGKVEEEQNEELDESIFSIESTSSLPETEEYQVQEERAGEPSFDVIDTPHKKKEVIVIPDEQSTEPSASKKTTKKGTKTKEKEVNSVNVAVNKVLNDMDSIGRTKIYDLVRKAGIILNTAQGTGGKRINIKQVIKALSQLDFEVPEDEIESINEEYLTNFLKSKKK
jgi:hypothetical protein